MNNGRQNTQNNEKDAMAFCNWWHITS